MKTKTINVSKEIIAESKKLIKQEPDKTRSCCCPIALAMQKEFNNSNIRVFTKKFHSISNEGPLIMFKDYPLPLEAKQFIEKFDTGSPVTPISFEISI